MELSLEEQKVLTFNLEQTNKIPWLSLSSAEAEILEILYNLRTAELEGTL